MAGYGVNVTFLGRIVRRRESTSVFIFDELLHCGTAFLAEGGSHEVHVTACKVAAACETALAQTCYFERHENACFCEGLQTAFGPRVISVDLTAVLAAKSMRMWRRESQSGTSFISQSPSPAGGLYFTCSWMGLGPIGSPPARHTP